MPFHVYLDEELGQKIKLICKKKTEKTKYYR